MLELNDVIFCVVLDHIRMVQVTFIAHHHHGFVFSFYVSFQNLPIAFLFETFKFMNLRHYRSHPLRICLQENYSIVPAWNRLYKFSMIRYIFFMFFHIFNIFCRLNMKKIVSQLLIINWQQIYFNIFLYLFSCFNSKYFTTTYT